MFPNISLLKPFWLIVQKLLDGLLDFYGYSLVNLLFGSVQ